MSPEYIVNVSWGNDSVALLQHMANKGLAEKSVVLHCDTGWAAPWWAERIEKCEAWAKTLGFESHTCYSEGMVPVVRERQAWPFHGAQFCTEELKIMPAIRWMESIDPNRDSIVCIGIRRQESKNRSTHPEWIESSEKHGRRTLWAPLVRHTNEDRDALLEQAGFEVLQHRSMECYPCVNANRRDILMLDEDRIALIEMLEEQMGFTSTGAPKTFFRPRGKRPAGIRAVVEWAKKSKGPDPGTGGGCSSGYCD